MQWRMVAVAEFIPWVGRRPAHSTVSTDQYSRFQYYGAQWRQMVAATSMVHEKR